MVKASSVIMPAGIQLSRESAVPLYMQLYQQIRAMIAGGRLRPANRIPYRQGHNFPGITI